MPEDNQAEVVNTEVVEETTASEATTEETNSPATQTDSGELILPETESTKEAEASSDSDDDTEETEETDQPKSRAEQRKEELDTEIEELERKLTPQEEIREKVAKRNELRQQVEALNAQAYQAPPVPSVDELVEQVNPATGDYYNRLEAEVEIMKQREAAREYNDSLRQYSEQVAESLATLEGETQAVLEKFPQFDATNPENSEFKGLIEEAGSIINSGLQYDPNTNAMIGSTVSPYKLYNVIDMAYKAGARSAETKGQKSVEKMLANADTAPTGQASAKPYEKLTLAQKQAWLRKRGYDV